MVKMPSDRGYLTNFTQKLIQIFVWFWGRFTEKEKKKNHKTFIFKKRMRFMVPKVLGSYCYTERIKEILNKKHSPSYHVLHHSVVVSLAVRHHQLRTSHVPQLITVMHQHQNNQGRPWSFHNPSKLRSGIAQETKTRSNFENSFFVCVHFNG